MVRNGLLCWSVRVDTTAPKSQGRCAPPSGYVVKATAPRNERTCRATYPLFSKLLHRLQLRHKQQTSTDSDCPSLTLAYANHCPLNFPRPLGHSPGPPPLLPILRLSQRPTLLLLDTFVIRRGAGVGYATRKEGAVYQYRAHLEGVVARCGTFLMFLEILVKRPTANHSGGCSQIPMLVDGHQRPLVWFIAVAYACWCPSNV